MKWWMTFILAFGNLAWSLPKELYSTDWEQKQFLENPNWDNFKKWTEIEKQNERIEGTAYYISGGVAFIGGIVGYHNSRDVFAKGAYAISQSLGVAAVGYGAHQSLLGSDYRNLYETLQRDQGLSARERDQFVRIYFSLEKERSQEAQKIAAITHGMLAGLNIYNGSVAQNEDLRSTLYFIAAINLLATISYAF